MVTLNCAYTQPINPPSATPKLSQEQVWKGLQIKIREAQRFVPVIESCKVLSEDTSKNEVTREAKFKGQAEGVKEVCRSFWPTKVDFCQTNGAVITNTISDGEDGGMLMTYTLEWRHPEVAEGSDEHKKLVEEHKQGAKMAVSKSLEAMRKMASDGELD